VKGEPGSKSASILVTSDHKGIESCTVWNPAVAARTDGQEERQDPNGIVVSPKCSASRLIVYEKYIVNGELKPPASMTAPFASATEDEAAASHVKRSVSTLEMVPTTTHLDACPGPMSTATMKQKLRVSQEAEPGSSSSLLDNAKSIDRKNSKKKSTKPRESGDRVGRSKHRKQDEGATATGDLKKKTSNRGRSKGREGKRPESDKAANRRRHSLDAKLRKKASKDRTKANHKENSAVQELGKSLSNFNW
jgi:hypothetical protein